MKTCTVFITQCILIVVWIGATICYPSNSLLIFGLLAIVVLNVALLFYSINNDMKRETLCLDDHREAILKFAEKIDIQSEEIKALIEAISKQKASNK